MVFVKVIWRVEDDVYSWGSYSLLWGYFYKDFDCKDLGWFRFYCSYCLG